MKLPFNVTPHAIAQEVIVTLVAALIVAYLLRNVPQLRQLARTDPA